MILTPQVDSIEAMDSEDYVLSYASRLPFAFYFAVTFLVVASILTREQSHRMLLVLLLAVLLEVTPNIMLTNPWLPDQYPYMAEPVGLMKNRHIFDFHYLDSTPGLALMFSGVLLAANASPLILWQLAPLFGILATLFVILIGREIGANGPLSGLLFLAFNFWYQTNIFHRQTFSFLLFLVSILFLLRILHKRRFPYSVGYMVILTTIVLSHPGTSAFMVTSLVIAAVGFQIFKNGNIRSLVLFSVIVFLAYNIYVSVWDFPRMIRFIGTSMQEIVGGGPEQAPALFYLSGHTDAFDLVLNSRILVSLLYLGISSITAIYILVKMGDPKTRFVTLLHMGFLLQLVAFLFGGPYYRMRPLFFVIPTSALLFSMSPTWIKGFGVRALRFLRLAGDKTNRTFTSKALSKSFRSVSLICLVLVFLIAPILRYSGIPYLHPPSEELSAKLFLDQNYGYDSPIFATERNLPYEYSLLVSGQHSKGEPDTVWIPEKDLSLNRSYFLVRRYGTRDGYWVYNVTFVEVLEALQEQLPKSHNLVYESDRFHRVFLERR